MRFSIRIMVRKYGVLLSRHGVVPRCNAGVSPAPSIYSLAMLTIRSRGRLPHWEIESSIYFVTFRLFDSLPQNVIRALEFERLDIIRIARAAGRPLSPSEEQRMEELLSHKIQKYLDNGVGCCYLANPSIASIVAQTLQRFDRVRYRLHAWCVMPNHVHVLFRIFPRHGLADVLHMWKSYSAKKGNLLLRRSGDFWEREYYDHLVRNEREFYRITRYILQNPEKAGVRNWRWKYATAKLREIVGKGRGAVSGAQ